MHFFQNLCTHLSCPLYFLIITSCHVFLQNFQNICCDFYTAEMWQLLILTWCVIINKTWANVVMKTQLFLCNCVFWWSHTGLWAHERGPTMQICIHKCMQLLKIYSEALSSWIVSTLSQVITGICSALHIYEGKLVVALA